MKRSGLFLLALVILVVGLGVDAAIYILADEREAQAYIIVGGTAYPVDPTTSRAYQGQLERYGGKMAVLFDEINRSLGARFQGKQLGITLASVSALTAL